LTTSHSLPSSVLQFYWWHRTSGNQSILERSFSLLAFLRLFTNQLFLSSLGYRTWCFPHSLLWTTSSIGPPFYSKLPHSN
jgi:hypothetical protein